MTALFTYIKMIISCLCLICFICLGAPLVENDLTDLPDLKAKITKWLLFKSMDNNSKPLVNAGEVDAHANSKDGISPGKIVENDNKEDLYDF